MKKKLEYIKIITASLYVSLIPLHNNKYHDQMMKLAKKVIRSIQYIQNFIFHQKLIKITDASH